ncbi:MAG: hypothetical protein M1825_005552 [Sarcosagium campestre]|nr:MAG: hypothetical protein M1825_005552 [Sarcosagium campestre]
MASPKKMKWTAAENERLLCSIAKHHSDLKYAKLVTDFPGLTINGLRLHLLKLKQRTAALEEQGSTASTPLKSEGSTKKSSGKGSAKPRVKSEKGNNGLDDDEKSESDNDEINHPLQPSTPAKNKRNSDFSAGSKFTPINTTASGKKRTSPRKANVVKREGSQDPFIGKCLDQSDDDEMRDGTMFA